MMRIILILSSSAAIVLIGLYSFFTHPLQPFPEKYGIEKSDVNKPLRLSYLLVLKSEGDILYAKDDTNTLLVDVEDADFHREIQPEPGERVSVKAVFTGGNTVKADFIHTHKYQSYKIYVSVIALFIVIFLFFKYFKFDVKQLLFVKR